MKKHITVFDLSRYIEGEIVGTELSDIEAHLGSCELCRKELASLKSMITVSAQLKSGSVDDLNDFVSKVIERRQAQSRVITFRKRYYPAAAAAAFLLFAGTGIFFEMNSRQNKTSESFASKINENTKPAKAFAVQSLELSMVDYEDVVGQSTSVKTIVNTLQKNHARITKITDSYVEADVAFDNYQNIRDGLGFTVIPAGFVGSGVDLASAGSDDTSVSSGMSPVRNLKIRIRR